MAAVASLSSSVAVEQRGPAALIPLSLADGSLSVDRDSPTLGTISFRFIKIHPSPDICSSRSAVNRSDIFACSNESRRSMDRHDTRDQAWNRGESLDRFFFSKWKRQRVECIFLFLAILLCVQWFNAFVCINGTIALKRSLMMKFSVIR